ncbi:MAG: FAD-binding protein [Gemmatimonadota bacterium]
MKRRTFLRSSMAAAAAATLPFPQGRPRLFGLYRPPSGGSPDVPAVTGDGREVTLRGGDLADLAARIRGRILLAQDDGYEEARRILNPSFDRRPALIAQVTGAADVRAAVDFARDNGGLLTAVKCGGHSLSGKSTCDRGIMIDLSTFRGVHVDPIRRRARVAGGTLLGQVDHETMSHGLVTPMGTVSHTGAGGLVTGGGFGRLARRWGLSLDNVTAVDVVTADGSFVRANQEEHPDLFWGVRGGGGNFGVVTSFEFQLHPLERRVLAGPIFYPMARAREVLTLYGDYAPVAPDGLQLDLIMVRPPAGGEAMAGFAVCYSGPAGQADGVLAPLRSLGTPMVDGIQGVDYVALQRSGDTDDPRAQGTYTKSGFIEAMTPELMRILVNTFQGHPQRATVLFAQHSGGAINRVLPDATAFPQRNVLANLLCFVDWPFGQDPTEHVRWIQAFWQGVEPHTQGFYVNDLEEAHSADDVGLNYQRNHQRLVAVKNRYDPANLFRLNANVIPTV